MRFMASIKHLGRSVLKAAVLSHLTKRHVKRKQLVRTIDVWEHEIKHENHPLFSGS